MLKWINNYEKYIIFHKKNDIKKFYGKNGHKKIIFIILSSLNIFDQFFFLLSQMFC